MYGGRCVRGLAAALALVLLARPSPALAHAVLVRSDPPNACALLPFRLPPDDPRCAAGAILATPPGAVQLWFSEPVQPFAGGIAVVGPNGRRIEHGRVQTSGAVLSIPIDATEEGSYLVRWRVISGDTHPVRGSFGFSVGHPSVGPGSSALQRGDVGGVSTSELAMQVASRWLHFVGFALGFGPLAFLLLVLRPLGADSGAATRRLWRLVTGGVVAMLAAGLLALVAQVASLAPGELLDPDTIGDVLGSSFGRILALQVSAALFLWVLLGVIEQGSLRAVRTALGLGIVLAFVDGGSTHAVSSGPAPLGLTLNVLHMAAMGVWAGGLATLLTTWRLRELNGRRVEVLRRFARPAAACLALLVVSGVAMASLRLRQPVDLLEVAYGRALAMKAVAVLAVTLLAITGSRPLRARRQRWWSLEAGGLIGVLALAGLLVSLPPPR